MLSKMSDKYKCHIMSFMGRISIKIPYKQEQHHKLTDTNHQRTDWWKSEVGGGFENKVKRIKR